MSIEFASYVSRHEPVCSSSTTVSRVRRRRRITRRPTYAMRDSWKAALLLPSSHSRLFLHLLVLPFFSLFLVLSFFCSHSSLRPPSLVKKYPSLLLLARQLRLQLNQRAPSPYHIHLLQNNNSGKNPLPLLLLLFWQLLSRYLHRRRMLIDLPHSLLAPLLLFSLLFLEAIHRKNQGLFLLLFLFLSREREKKVARVRPAVKPRVSHSLT